MTALRKMDFLRAIAVIIGGGLLTLYGFINAWQAVEAPDKLNRTLALLLLWPFGAASTLIRTAGSGDHLSQAGYRLSLVLGGIGQLIYYSLLFAGIEWCVRGLMRRK